MGQEVADQIDYAWPPPSEEAALAGLSAPFRSWFLERFQTPTQIQRLSWPLVAAGRNVLISGPTGGGKSLAAFVPVLQQLLAAPFVPSVRCLYVAPLKALVNDAATNLRQSLIELHCRLTPGLPVPSVEIRTGDATPTARKRLRTHPPDFLLTTPESLAVMLTQEVSRQTLANVRHVIVDEVHALAANKRGADLSLSLERLTGLALRPIQRIGMSATCTPLAEAARFLVGAHRPCTIAHVPQSNRLDLRIEPLLLTGGFWRAVVERLVPELARNRTTLIFTNVRSSAERLSWLLSRRYPEWHDAIGVHHASIARGRRSQVEQRLREGKLRVVVSSSTLELGVDIGSIDGVVLVHPPGCVVRLLQRVGRGGHVPDGVRRGLILTASPAELMEAAVTAASGRAAEFDQLASLAHPLDVLCQQLLGMATQRSWSADEGFELVRRAYPYRGLSRADFDGCLAYLAGLHRDGSPWLPPRLAWAESRWRVFDERTTRILRRNIGTILSEDAAKVRLRDGEPVGEVDEGFADRLKPGDRFLLEGHVLEFHGLDRGTVVVDAAFGLPVVPRWGGNGWSLSAELARRLYALRVQAAETLRDGPGALRAFLQREYQLPPAACELLAGYFQKQECVSEIPDLHTFLCEIVADESEQTYYFHTPLNQAANDALARVAVMRLARRHELASHSIVAELGFAFHVRARRPLGPAELQILFQPDEFVADLDAGLADSALVRERFRRVALTGLMLLRNPLGKRHKVGGVQWAEQRLYDRVHAAEPDFVLLQQARREVRQECCDADRAYEFVQGLARCRWQCRFLETISPFAENWSELAPGPAEDVSTPDEALLRLHAALTQARVL